MQDSQETTARVPSFILQLIPFCALITLLNIYLIPLHPIHRSHIKGLYPPQLLNIFLLILGQLVDNLLWRAHRDTVATDTARLAERCLVELPAKGVRSRVLLPDERDLVTVWINADGCSSPAYAAVVLLDLHLAQWGRLDREVDSAACA